MQYCIQYTHMNVKEGETNVSEQIALVTLEKALKRTEDDLAAARISGNTGAITQLIGKSAAYRNAIEIVNLA
jgi:hypothetical protein